MKIASLVPSWTETLIRSGADVVGRTRYCLHPQNEVASIPVLGGTKSVDWSRLQVQPDLVIFDREENKKEMADSCPFPFWASHIRKLSDLGPQMAELASKISSPKLQEFSERWRAIDSLSALQTKISAENPSFPGLIRWFVPPTEEVEEIAYFVWRKPWMILQRQTFIGSLLEKLGFRLTPYPSEELYPKVDLDWLLQRPKIAFFFSSEPYPFENKEEELKGFQPPTALVDGEAFGWFGIRSLEFVEGAFKNQRDQKLS
ncbi:MAG: Fe3+-siderophores ABC transporter protein [Bradymonadales bacterium]|nr:MAG: Fe3+-siderophores ABC transporter protein [Bradymonadales bacterium]